MSYNQTSTESSSKAFKKSEGFINISLPKGDGSKAKIGTIYLDSVKQRELLDLLKADESNLELVRHNFILDFQLASPEGIPTGFKLVPVGK
jgi:hypothetical protein